MGFVKKEWPLASHQMKKFSLKDITVLAK